MKKTFVLFSSAFLFLTITIFAQPVINGDLTDGGYTTIATKQNNNSGFGSAIDVSKIVYFADAPNQMLYLGIEGKLDVTNDNAIGVWLNLTGTGSPTGFAAGTSLGFSGAGNYMDGDNGNNIDFKADFEDDYMFAFNPGFGNTSVYWDASSHVGGGSVAEYQGSCDQSGTSATNSNAAGGIFTQNSITFAFNNDGAANHGLEMAIPFSELGADASMSIQVFAFVVSSTGYFSDVTVPGDVTTGNLANNPDFSTLAGGPYHSDPPSTLPVELTSFTAAANAGFIQLNWATASEINNSGFEVQRKINTTDSGNNWITIGFRKGHGTTTNPSVYSYNDYIQNIATTNISYRLKQVDFNGNFTFSNPVTVNNIIPGTVELLQNYPNPFNPTTKISYSIPQGEFVSLKVYDVLGNEVSTLVNNYKDAGNYSVNFNGTSLSSGIYFYRLQAGDHIYIKKMTLMK